MVRAFIIVVAFLASYAPNCFASFYSSGYSKEAGTIVAAVQIKEKGIYNLIITIQFLNRPQKSKIYSSDEYEKLVDRLLVESRGVALQKVLERKELAISDFAELKKAIEADIAKLASQLKQKFLPDQDAEVVFAISDLFLLEPTDK